MEEDATEDDVVLADVPDLAGVGLAGVGDVALEVDDALGVAGGAGAVEPERHVVAVGGCRVEGVGLCGKEVGETQDRERGFAAADDVGGVGHALERFADRGNKPLVDDDHLGVAVLREEAVVGGTVARVDRHGHGTETDGAEEDGGEVGRVAHDHEYALLAADAQAGQRVGGAATGGQELGVGDALVVAVDGDLVGAARVDVGIEHGGDVVTLGRNSHVALRWVVA